MLELSIRPSDHEHEHQDEHARSRACFHWIINGTLIPTAAEGCGESQIRLTQDSGVLDRE